MDIGETIGENLERFIAKSGYSSKERFAYEHGIDKSALSKILRGKRLPRIDTLIRIAEALEVTLNDIYMVSAVMEKGTYQTREEKKKALPEKGVGAIEPSGRRESSVRKAKKRKIRR